MSLVLASADALLNRLSSPGGREVVWLVGSALTMPSVPGVSGVVELIRAGLDRSLRRAFEREMADAGPAAQYQSALRFVRDNRGGADAMNAVIRDAVLKAHRVGGVDLAALEAEVEGWRLTKASKALGWIAAKHPEKARAVLTTNFDPLVEVAIRWSGGEAHDHHLTRDGAPSLDHARGTAVVHLHGGWRGDTLHTPGVLAKDRPALKRALAALLRERTLVVMAYGGWDDVFTEALAEVAADATAKPDVLWCFYEGDGENVAARYGSVLKTLGEMGERAALYGGINCHEVLPALRARLDGEAPIFGRGRLIERLQDAVDKGQAVELVGEPCMGRSALLEWLRGWVTEEGMPVAFVDARKLAVPHPVYLMRDLAEALDPSRRLLAKVKALADRESALPTAAGAIAALDVLPDGTWLLID
ncbi:MAG: SIR2 family protein, partial [Myxococcales bacterium]|nr:SIR2 family protein [Myxococcales bacterium]